MVMADIKEPPVDPAKAEKWMGGLIEATGMMPLIAPKAKYCDIEGNRGLTCICAIETSHMVLHAWDEDSPGQMQLDVYTCSDLDLDVVWKAIEGFGPVNLKYKFYDRKGGFYLLDEDLGHESKVIKALTGSTWHFAKTMPEIPHWYTRGREWDDHGLFVEAVRLINIKGVEEEFGGRKYKYLYHGPYKYWTVEPPYVKPHKHILINRTVGSRE